MEVKTLKEGQIIFKEGAPGGCMYEVAAGKVGVYANYGMPGQKLLREYYPDQYFGEMGLVDEAPRSATAVALTNDTWVIPITEAGFEEFFSKNPVRVWMIMQQMSYNLRRRTIDYVEVCEKIKELTEKEAQA